MEFNAVVKKKHIFMLSKILDDVEFKMKGVTQEEIGLDMISCIIRGMHKAEKSVDELVCSVYGLIDVDNLTTKEYMSAVANIIKNPDFVEAWGTLTAGLNSTSSTPDITKPN